VAPTIVALLLLFSRRPDAVLNPQFWAEDGPVFYAPEFNDGARAVFIPNGGYLHVAPRLVGLAAVQLPMLWAPALFNAVALIAQVLPVVLLASSRFEALIPRYEDRLLLGFLYVAAPGGSETHATLTHMVRYLAITSCMVMIAGSARFMAWRVFDGAVILACGISGPFTLLLLPTSLYAFWRRRSRDAAAYLIIVAGTAAIQAASLLIWSDQRDPVRLGASATNFVRIIGGQYILGGVIGTAGWKWLTLHSWMDVAAAAAFALGIPVLARAFYRAQVEARMLYIFGATTLSAALLSPLADPYYQAWSVMWRPGSGSRYWLIGTLCLLLALVLGARERSPMRWPARALAILLPIGIVADWFRPAYEDLHYPAHVRRIVAALPNEEVDIPLNPPGWTMTLRKPHDQR